MKKLFLFEKEEPLDFIIFRPLASLLVSFLKKTPILPNHITIMAMILGSVAGLFFFLNTITSIITGIILIFIAIVLDCSDGQLARAKNIHSYFGRILDGFSDSVVIFFIYLFICLFYTINGDYFIWIWGIIGAISHSVQCNMYDFYKNQYKDYVFNGIADKHDELKDLNDNLKKLSKKQFFKKFLLIIFINYIKSQNFYVKPDINLRTKLDEKLNDDFREKYRKYNIVLFQIWGLQGPTSHLVYIMLFAFFYELKYFLIFESSILNILLAILWIIQYMITRKIKKII